MKLLTAAVGGVPGELVLSPPACDTPSCGCREDFIGMTSGGLVAVAVVADVPLDGDDLEALVRAWLVERKWPDDDELVRDVVAEMVEDAQYGLGWRVRRVDDRLVAE